MRSLRWFAACFAICITIFISCKSNREEENRVYLELNEQLEKSTQHFQGLSSNYLHELDSKTYDPHSAEKAGIWLPKAKLIHHLTSDVFSYLDTIKQSIRSNESSKYSDKLHGVVNSLVTKLSSIDSNMTKQLKTKIETISGFQDSTGVFDPGFSADANLSLLSDLQNRVSILEMILVRYCVNQSVSNFDGYYVMIPLITQNSIHLNNNEELEINVGVGFLNYPGYPKVYINGDSLSSAETGLFNYKMKVSGKAGKYSVPVKIEYYENLEKIKMQKMVEYYID